MEPEDGYFDEPVAATYDESSEGMFDPAVVGPTVEATADSTCRSGATRAAGP